MSLTHPSLQVLSKTSDFRISGQSLIKENCHNSTTTDDIDMKLGPVTKLHKRYKKCHKNLTMASCQQNCGVIVIFLIYGQFGVILIATFILRKTENRNPPHSKPLKSPPRSGLVCQQICNGILSREK